LPRGPDPATRFRTDDSLIESFIDRIRGPCEIPFRRLGDPVVRRKDGLFAYQLAVVVDDEEQGITDVVRGGDLLLSTAWQRALQRALGFRALAYAHLPLVTEADGSKLAKSRHAVPLDGRGVPAALTLALRLLGQAPPDEEVWDWALAHWQPLRAAQAPVACL
jgi:glutamyl-Q tRNA(Asp) synthetase